MDNKLSEDFLLDNFLRTGNKIEDLESLIKEVDEHTSFEQINSNELTVMSYKEQDDEDQKLYFYALNPKDLYDADKWLKKQIITFNKSGILKRGDFDALIDETTTENKMMLYDGFKLLFASNSLMFTIDRFGLNGDFVLTPNLIRDAAIAKQFQKNLKCTMVIKSFNNIKKVFSVLSGKYAHIKQSTIINVINEISKSSLGKPVCYEWNMTHNITSIYVEFPEKADDLKKLYKLKEDLIPGLWIATSDTGHCSLKIRGTWRYKSAITFNEEISKRHIGDINISKIQKEVNETIFSEYNKLPEALCELMLLNITDPTWDVSTPSGQYLNGQAIKNTIHNLFSDMNMVGEIGKKNTKSIETQLINEFDPSLSYTAYDMAMAVMSMADRLSGNTVTIEKLQKVCGKAAYQKYDTENRKEKSAVILTA